MDHRLLQKPHIRDRRMRLSIAVQHTPRKPSENQKWKECELNGEGSTSDISEEDSRTVQNVDHEYSMRDSTC